MRRTTPLLGCLLVCLSGAPALAQQQTLAPPGASGVDEYLETIPTAEGNRPSGGSAPGHSLSAPQRRALAKLGPDGARAAAVADLTGSPLPARSHGERPPQVPAAHADSPFLGTVVRALGGGGGGVGGVLPAVLLVSLLAFAVLGLRRRGAA